MSEEMRESVERAKQRLAKATCWDKPRRSTKRPVIRHFAPDGQEIDVPLPTLGERLQGMQWRANAAQIDRDYLRGGFSPYMRHAR